MPPGDDAETVSGGVETDVGRGDDSMVDPVL